MPTPSWGSGRAAGDDRDDDPEADDEEVDELDKFAATDGVGVRLATSISVTMYGRLLARFRSRYSRMWFW